MIDNIDPTLQSLLGTLFTWALTAAGSAGVYFLDSSERKILDGSLGFAGGVMLAASYWSLLKPSIEIASNTLGEHLACLPATVGFVVGAVFVYLVDVLLPEKDTIRLLRNNDGDHKKNDDLQSAKVDSIQWKRIVMLLVAITMHNIPEGLAVGVGFGAAKSQNVTSFSSARNLAIGIGIQNFPEGLAVSLPLKAAGFSNARAFWYGQLSGLVEPISGVLGSLLIVFIEPILPYALAFAAGAMIFVVVDDIIPEAQRFGNGKLASWSNVAGFIVMMVLEAALG